VGLALDDDALLGRDVVERELKSPVEVAFAVQRSAASNAGLKLMNKYILFINSVL